MCFVEGLRPDLKADVLIQMPSDLDTASVLAQLQDEATNVHKRRDQVNQVKPDYWTSGPVAPKAPFPPSLPTKIVKVVTPLLTKGKKNDEFARGRPSDDKLALRAYRRARGLCQCCAKKWSQDHKCPATVPRAQCYTGGVGLISGR
jgi:hypothetical protein